MPPKTAESVAKYEPKTRQKSQTDQKTSFLLSIKNYIHCAAANSKKFENFSWSFFRGKNPNGPFQFGICFENQFQDQKECYYVVINCY